MFLKKTGKLISLIALYWVLAQYSFALLCRREPDNYLLASWQSYFSKLNVHCIHWIAMRIVCWGLVFLQMMKMETGITVYLFLRQRNYKALFGKMYLKCLETAGIYFGSAMLFMATAFSLITGSFPVPNQALLAEALSILLRETIDCLNLCLGAYLLFLITKRMEMGVLIALALRLLAGFLTRGDVPALWVQLLLHIPLGAGTLRWAARSFMRRITENG